MSMNRASRYPYRVFLSYSHRDAAIQAAIESHLTKLGALPISDKAFGPGVGINKQIVSKIAYAHIFLPIITKNSVGSCYVQNEIGYAFGTCLPILPVCVDATPQGMLKDVLGLKLGKDLCGLQRELKRSHLDKLVQDSQEPSRPAFVCADHTYERCALIKSYVRAIEKAFQPRNRVRYSAAFSSFSIPRDPDDPSWLQRDGRMRSFEVRQQLSEERLALEAQARGAGCDLEIDPFVHPYQRLTSSADFVVCQNPDLSKACRITRLQILKEFVASVPSGKVRLVVRHNELDGNLLIFGSWFLVESKAPRPAAGFLQSVFTQNAPWVLKRIRAFDDTFSGRFRDERLSAKADALEKIDACITEISKWPDL